MSLLFSINSYCQYTVSGMVTNANNEKLDYFHAVLLNKLDSSFVVGGVFEDGSFELSVNKHIEYILLISYVGYEKYVVLVDFSQSRHIDLGQIILKEITLDEVTVRAKRPTYKKEDGMTVMNVESTSLSEAGTAIDVLKRTPGVIIDKNDNVNIFGKGSPVIYINGIEVKGNSELKLLQSDDIKVVKIDKNPGARYDADTKAVILIERKKKDSDFLNAEIYNRSFIGRKYSNQVGLQLNNKISRFTNHLGYQWSDDNIIQYPENYEINTQQNYTQYNNSDEKDDLHSLIHSVVFGTEYAIDSLNKLSVQYNGDRTNNDIETTSDQKIFKTNADSIYRKTVSFESNKKTTNSFSSCYRRNFVSDNSLILQYDFANIETDSHDLINENNLNSGTQNGYLITNSGNYKVNAVKSDYNLHYIDSTDITGGIKASCLYSNGSTSMKNIADGDILNNEDNKITDRIIAGYIIIDKESDSYSLKLGLRTERTRSSAYLDGKSVLDTSYFNLFPSASFEYNVNDNLSVSFEYNRTIDRPSFEEINPNIDYIDSLAYQQGNPLIRPMYSQDFCLDFSLWNSIYLSGEYLRNKDERFFSAFNDAQNADILRYSYVNISRSEHLLFDLSHGFVGKKIDTNFSIDVDFPFLDIPYQNNIRKIRKPIWYFSANCDYSFNKNVGVYSNIDYETKGEDGITLWGETCNVSMGIDSNFFNKKLFVKLQVDDIFNKSDMSWKDQYGNIITGQRPDYDLRRIIFSVKYKFNNFKNVFKPNSSVQEEMKRFEQRKR